MLRKIRISVSVLIILTLSLYLVDFAGLLPVQFHALAQIQFIPALLSLNIAVLIAILAATLVFGRIYCSSVCPLGVYQDVVNFVSRKFRKKKRFNYRKAQSLLRWLFVGVTIAAFVGGFTFLVGFLDPYSAYSRMVVHLFKPAYMAGNNLLEAIFSHFDNHRFYTATVYLASVTSLVVALISLLGIGLMAAFNGRDYCNTICPVGTVLGFFSKFALLKIRINESKCNSCGSCTRNCKASCIDSKNHSIDYSRCINCFDCLDVCSKKAMSFSFARNTHKNKSKRYKVDHSKRTFLLAMGGTGLAASQVLASKTIPALSAPNTAKRQVPISPPGSLSHANLMQKCTSCHLCVAKCPQQIIKPAFTEYGLAGIMQPILSFDRGFCNYDCTICSDVCPVGAILPLSQDAKHTTQTGIVHFIKENCIVVTDQTNCGACSEHCPTQAVSMVPYTDDLDIPFTQTAICVGCGGCEYVCPAKPNKAIYVEGITKHASITLVADKKEDIKVDDFGF
jgi:polyferredoxin